MTTTVREIASAPGLHRSITCRLLRTVDDHQFVEPDVDDTVVVRQVGAALAAAAGKVAAALR